MKSTETFMICQMYRSLFGMVHRCGNTLTSHFCANFSILIVNSRNWGLQQNIWTSEHGAKMKSQTVLNNCWMAWTAGWWKAYMRIYTVFDMVYRMSDTLPVLFQMLPSFNLNSNHYINIYIYFYLLINLFSPIRT